MYSYRNMPIECIRTDEGFNSLREEWNKLLRDSWSNNIFLTWEWMYTWWKIFKGNSKLMILTIRDKMGKLVCVAPFRRTVVKYHDVLPVGRIQFLGTGEDKNDRIGSKYLDIIILKKGRKIEEELLDRLFKYVIEEEIWDEIILENLREDSITLKLMDGLRHSSVREQLIVEKEWSRYLVLPDSWDKFIGSLFSDYRYHMNSALKAMEGLGEVKFKMVETEEELEQIFKELVELQLSVRTWRVKWNLGVFSGDKYYHFHLTILRLLFRAGNLMMARLSINDKLCGVIYNIHYNRLALFYQLGVRKNRTQQYPWLSPGLAMHVFAIKKAIEWGCKEYDFLVDDNRAIYKRCWLHNVRKIFNMTLIRNRAFKIYTDRIATMHK